MPLKDCKDFADSICAKNSPLFIKANFNGDNTIEDVRNAARKANCEVDVSQYTDGIIFEDLYEIASNARKAGANPRSILMGLVNEVCAQEKKNFTNSQQIELAL